MKATELFDVNLPQLNDVKYRLAKMVRSNATPDFADCIDADLSERVFCVNKRH